MRFVVIATLFAFVGCVSAPKANSLTETRLKEGGRTEFYGQCLSAGVPATACRCMELKMVQKHYRVEDLNRERVQALSTACFEEQKEVLMQELKDWSAEREAAEEAAAP